LPGKIGGEEFRRQFKDVRPHSSLGQFTPAEFNQKLSTMSPEPAIF
jgi:transposase InsO family protein